jgi:hypothetical protein
MAYTRGNSSQIIVGAAALFTYEDGVLTDNTLPDLVDDVSYKTTLSNVSTGFRNVGYTMNGLEIQFQPDFGEVAVDQVLDVAKLYKQGMQVNLNTTFAESTLENLLFALAGKSDDLGTTDAWAGPNPTLNMSAGDIGECPVERGLVAVGPGTGDCAAGSELQWQQSVTKRQCSKYHSAFFQMTQRHMVRSLTAQFQHKQLNNIIALHLNWCGAILFLVYYNNGNRDL